MDFQNPPSLTPKEFVTESAIDPAEREVNQ
jgi:hypothetical protein